MRIHFDRRYARISLRVVLLAMAAISIPLGIWADRAHRRERAVAALSRGRSAIVYAHEVKKPYRPDWRCFYLLPFYRDPPTPGPKWLRRIIGDHFFTEVACVGLGSHSGDDALDHLQAFPRLLCLDARFSQITDVGLLKAAKLTGLDELNLHHTAVSDDGLAALRTLVKLRILDLSDTRISNQAIKSLRPNVLMREGLVYLEALDLNGTDVSDEVVDVLAQGFYELRSVSFGRTSVSKEARERLRAAWPNCGVYPNP